MNRPFPVNRPGQPSVAMIILGITVLAYFVQQAMPNEAIRLFALWPADGQAPVRFLDGRIHSPGFAPWLLVSYGLLHGGLWHLLFEMFALDMFGCPAWPGW